MKGPKVAVIGAGSYFFGKAAIWNMINSEILREGTLALVDTDAKVLDVMMKLAQKAIAAAGVTTKLIGSTDRKQVIADSDFVVLTFSFRNAYYRGLDTMISRKYGVTMCSSDTIGPGGIFRALREVPEILNVARDIKELCPDAWLINFINPSTVNGIALQRFAPEVKSFALCDGNHLPYAEGDFMKLAGLLPESFNHRKESIPADLLKDFSYKLSGINHLTFIFECTFKGEDRMPHIKEYINRKALEEWQVAPSPKAKPRLHFNYIKQFLDVYNAYPTAVSHSKEYVPFFQGYGVSPATPEPIITFDAYNRDEEMKAAWAHTEKLANGEIPIEEFLKNGCGDHATDIIESMWGNLGKQFYINTLNRGTVPNMPADAVLEMKCDVDMNGPRPLPVGNMPRGLFGLQMQVLDTHELTAEAAVTCDRETLLRAMCTDPIINNIGDARNIMNELLELEREHLSEAWYK
jgi:alpha-galactosidase